MNQTVEWPWNVIKIYRMSSDLSQGGNAYEPIGIV